MWKRLKLHETFVAEALLGTYGEPSWVELKEFHERQVALFQHERLIHLIVTMFVALFALMAIGFAVFVVHWPVMLMALMFLGLTSAYLLHYFRLENGVQRLYELTNRIERELGVVSARYAENVIEPWNSARRG